MFYTSLFSKQILRYLELIILASFVIGFTTALSISSNLGEIWVLLAYLASSLVSAIVLRRFSLSPILVFTLDLVSKLFFIAIIDIQDLAWQLNKPYWFPDTNYFWKIVGQYIESWETGKFLMPWNLLDRNGLVTNFFWALLTYIGGDNIWIIPFSNAVCYAFATYCLAVSFRKMNLSSSISRLFLILFCVSPLSFYWILWGQKDAFITAVLAYTGKLFLSLHQSKKMSVSFVLQLCMVLAVLWYDRPYLAIFILLALNVYLLVPYCKSKLTLWRVSSMGIAGGICLFAILFLFSRELDYFLHNLVFMNIEESSSLLNNAPYSLKLLRLVLTPFPLRVDGESSVNILLSFGFFSNLLIQVLAFYCVWIALKSNLRLVYLIVPYLVFVFFWATFYPGYNRIRDTFVPMLIMFATSLVDSLLTSRVHSKS